MTPIYDSTNGITTATTVIITVPGTGAGVAWSSTGAVVYGGTTLPNPGSPVEKILEKRKPMQDHKWFRTQQRGKRWEK